MCWKTDTKNPWMMRTICGSERERGKERGGRREREGVGEKESERKRRIKRFCVENWMIRECLCVATLSLFLSSSISL